MNGTSSHRQSMFLARTAVAIAATVLSLVAIESGLRLYGYEAFRWSDRVNPQLLTATGNEELPYVLTPGAAGRGWDTDIRINSHGFRDREYLESRPDHGLRLVALGDSITFGSRIANVDDLYPKRLERRLRRHRQSRQAEVLNFGVTGYDVVNNVENLRVQALRFQPDIVVLAFCMNDIGYASTAMTYVQASRYVSNPIFRARVAQFFFSTVTQLVARYQSRQDEAVADFERINRSRIQPVADDIELAGLMKRLAVQKRGRRNQDIVNWWTEAPRLGFLEYALGRLSQLQREHRFAVVVVPVPFLDESSANQWHVINDIIRHESVKFGFHVVDLTAPFEAAGLKLLQNDPKDFIHPGPAGHSIIAEELDEFLYASELLRR